MGKTSYKSSTLFCIFNAKVRVALFDSALGGLNVILVQIFLRRDSRFFHWGMRGIKGYAQ
jgi:hypothetical protein